MMWLAALEIYVYAKISVVDNFHLAHIINVYDNIVKFFLEN